MYVSLAPLLGRAVREGVELAITNDELANAANITRYTASRLLNEWQRQRVVIKRRGKVVLRAPRQLFAHPSYIRRRSRVRLHKVALAQRQAGYFL